MVPAGEMLNAGVCVSMWQPRGRSRPRRKQQRLRGPKTGQLGNLFLHPLPQLVRWEGDGENRTQRLDLGRIPSQAQVELLCHELGFALEHSPSPHSTLPLLIPRLSEADHSSHQPLVLTSHCTRPPALIAQADNLAEGVC